MNSGSTFLPTLSRQSGGKQSSTNRLAACGLNHMKQHVAQLILALLVVLPGQSALSQEAASVPQTEADWEVLKTQPVPRWFDDAKFGIFIHWGPYSVMGYHPRGRGYAEHAPKEIYRDARNHYPFLDENFGAHPPDFGYKDIVPLFKAERWNPDAWAELFEKAGARYVVLTAEHHDGYALWDSDLTPWCATKIGPKRDLVGDLAISVRRRNLVFATSFHRERHTGFFALEKNSVRSAPQPDVAKEIERMPEAASLYGPFEMTDEFIADYVARWKEIETKYQPDFMWIDAIPVFHRRWVGEDYNDPQVQKFRHACRQMIADYFAAGKEWGKEVYVNNKGPAGAHNWPEGVGCREKDNMAMTSIGAKWQNPATLGTSYGYMKSEEERDAYKSPDELIRLLCDVVSKNGNLLLNIGPRADGTIPDGMQRRLLAMGDWLNVNGECIYGSRPWTVYGEQHGDRVKTHGRKTRTYLHDYRFTASADQKTVYAIVFHCPDQQVRIEAMKGLRIQSLAALGGDQPIDWAMKDDVLTAKLPHSHGDSSPMPVVFKVKLK